MITADGAYHCPVGSIRPFFISLKELWPRSCTCRLGDHFHLLSFLHITFALLCFIFERSDTGWLCDHFHPWQTVAGRHRPLWHIVPCQDNVTHTAPDGSYFIIFSSFFQFYRFLLYFIWLMWYWLFIFHHDTLRPVPKFFHTLCQIISTHWSLLLLLFQ